MKFCVEENMKPSQLETQCLLEERIARIPDNFVLPHNLVISCHLLVWSLVRFEYPAPLKAFNGWYAGHWEHSWLTDWRDARLGGGSVYDVYPVGTCAGSNAGVLFVDAVVARTPELYDEVIARKKRYLRWYGEGKETPIHPVEVVSPFRRVGKYVDAIEALVEVMR